MVLWSASSSLPRVAAYPLHPYSSLLRRELLSWDRSEYKALLAA
jgi:hypothetical protein